MRSRRRSSASACARCSSRAAACRIFPAPSATPSPALDWDQRALEPLRAATCARCSATTKRELDETGNIELRCWAVAAGALGERKPDIVQMDPSWHHNYASLAWWSPPPEAHAPHYPSIAPGLVELSEALHGLAQRRRARARYLADRAALCRTDPAWPASRRAALVAMDIEALAAMGVHPLVPFLANMQIQRLRRE